MLDDKCCLADLPGECVRCGKREADSADFLWVLYNKKGYPLCSFLCLARWALARMGAVLRGR